MSYYDPVAFFIFAHVEERRFFDEQQVSELGEDFAKFRHNTRT